VCAVLQVTDVELQPGEVVTHINLGDATRWSVESALSGSGSDQVEHLIIKPRDIGLSTSLVVTTDHRTYHLLLRSDEAEFMHDVTFLYDGEPPNRPAPSPTPSAQPTPSPAKVSDDPPPVHPAHDKGKQVVARHVGLVAADPADESYTVNGKADWRPVGVYNKDGKTYLEMPSGMKHKEAPVLFEEKRSGWFHHQKVLVNYRVHGKWYVVDRVLDNATLVSGVGAAQQKVDIRHVTKPTPKEKM
jgi:type IV secretion system protein VirB9